MRVSLSERMTETDSSPPRQANLACIWQLYWWNPPHGRALDMAMCVLKVGLLLSGLLIAIASHAPFVVRCPCDH